MQCLVAATDTVFHAVEIERPVQRNGNRLNCHETIVIYASLMTHVSKEDSLLIRDSICMIYLNTIIILLYEHTR